jgi:hypothetical protein
MKQGKKPMTKGVKIACAIIIIVAVIACIAVVVTDTDSSKTSSSSSKDENIIGISDTLHAQSFDFTITSAKLYNSITNQLGVTYTPDEGKQYLVLVIKATNTTDEDQNVVNSDFNSYLDNSKITPESVVGKVDGYMPLLGAISPGNNFEGYTVWQVPQKWNTFTFSYLDSLTGEDSDSFTIHSSDVQ